MGFFTRENELARYRQHMQTISDSGRGSVGEVDMCVEVVSSAVDKIEQGEGGFTPNGRHQVYLLDITCACK